MTGKDFLKGITNDQKNFLQVFLDILKKFKIQYCIIGGLAVNAYAEPVVSLDLDIVIVADKLDKIINILKQQHFAIKKFGNSINVSSPSSELRIQIQTDPRYQSFIKRKRIRNVLGYNVSVADIDDVFQGKIWSATDPERRASKRQKDLADIMRLMEVKPALISFLPNSLKKQLLI